MATKASASVTLSAVVDVKAVWRFYCLQSSTMAKPAKPTVYPPPQPWDDTEPGYDPTKTETLYEVDCNVFSDGTFSYTDVSVSTAFEAAKTAYNKAAGAESAANTALTNTENNASAIAETESKAFTEIARSQDDVILTIAKQYYTKEDTSRLVSEVSTQVKAMNDSIGLIFTQFRTDLDAVSEGADAEFEEIRKYIRFIDGKILLGIVGDELELKISNDRISFLQGGAEVAYFSNRKLYVTNGEYTNSLQIGHFAFIPRENGNLSFKKLGLDNGLNVVGIAAVGTGLTG